MTRINLVDPKTLSGKHLIAEYRELPRVLSLVSKRLVKIQDFDDVPSEYTMGSGHVRFFYDKLLFLKKRYDSIVTEMMNRGYSPQFRELAIDHFPRNLKNDWVPSETDIEKSRNRISERSK